jgi:hypothetical protein
MTTLKRPTMPKAAEGASAQDAALTSPRPELVFKPIPPSKQPGTYAPEPPVQGTLPDGGQTESKE